MKAPTKPTTPEEYIASLPENRQKIVAEMRKAIKKNLPKGFKEQMAYGMIGYVVPLSLYPDGYHCDPKLPLGFIVLGSTKGHIALHHLGIYASGDLLKWFQNEWPKHSQKKLDMGKGCIRFKKPEDVPLKLIGDLASKITPQQWIDQYERALSSRQ
jgi:uncharacterized protein YdhG (YjbR/CyaY superfamily)